MLLSRRPFLIIMIALFSISCSKKKLDSEILSSDSKLDTLAHDRMIGGLLVKGKVIDNQTRCSHYHTELDIIAIKFKCCDTYYPCYSCHAESTDHKPLTWDSVEWNKKAILCGACGLELSVQEYMDSNNTCPRCQSSFNPNCKKHYDLYFTMTE